MRNQNRKFKINLITLGCSKNLVDSELLMGQVRANGLEIVHNANHSDAGTVIINTCGFINDAKTESIDTILQYIRAKERGEVDHVFVMGCLSERYKTELEKEIREVDAFFGVKDLKHIIAALGIDYRKELVGERFLATPGHYAYMKISEGCDRICSFCAIPNIRGKHVSKPMKTLIDEASGLVQKGVKELILIAQDASYYGLDIYKSQKLPELAARLSAIQGLEWVRIHYTYPGNFPLNLLSEMASNGNICNYIDIPLQHINDGVLKKMRRNTTRSETIRLLDAARKTVPDAAIRTTMLVGHPGETEKAFRELRDFVSDFRFDRLGVFTYSHEEGTWGYRHFKNSLREKAKEERAAEIMEVQQQISMELNSEKTGKTLKVLVDREEGEYYVGRTEFDSPGVDHEVFVLKDQKKLETGAFYPVSITEATEFDLYGKNFGEDER